MMADPAGITRLLAEPAALPDAVKRQDGAFALVPFQKPEVYPLPDPALKYDAIDPSALMIRNSSAEATSVEDFTYR
jgi:hypothetical protein